MPTIDDLFHSTLSTLGYDGAVPDQILEYFGSLGYTGTLDDRWRQFFVAAGFTNLVEYLRDKGYEGSVQDSVTNATEIVCGVPSRFAPRVIFPIRIVPVPSMEPVAR